MAHSPSLLAACGTTSGPIALLSPCQFASTAGNTFVLTNVTTGEKEVFPAQGVGIQAFGACSKQGLLAYVTQETQPTLVLKNPTNSQSQSTALKGEQTSTAVAISQDGKHLFVARGHPAPNLQVYCCKSMNLITESPLEHSIVSLDVNPLDHQQAISTSTSAVHLHSIITSVGNKHLMKRSVIVPNSAATCHAFFPRVLYLGTADGNLLCYDFQGTLLEDAKGNSEGLKFEDEESNGLAVSSIVTTTTMVLVALAERSTCFSCSHFSASAEQQVLAQVQLDMCSNIQQMVLCGPEHSHLVVAPLDGCLLQANLHCDGGNISVTSESVFEGHAQTISGACPAYGHGSVATCSSDGSLCMWDCTTGLCKHRRTFHAHLTVVSALPQLLLLALGSRCGVLRIVYMSSGLPVMDRKRVSTDPIAQLSATCFSETGVLACLVGGCVLLIRVTEMGAISSLQEISLSAPALSLAVVPASDRDAMIYVLACLSTSELVCTLHMKEEGESDVPLLERRMRIAAPLLSMVCSTVKSGNSFGHVHGIALDHAVRCFDLPSDPNSWAVTKGRSSRPLEQIEVNTSLQDAHLAVHATRNNKCAVLGSRSGNVIMLEFRAQGAKHELQLGDVAKGGISAVAFDSSGTNVLCGTADGSVLFCTASGIKAAPEAAEAKPDRCILASDMDKSDEPSEEVLSLGQTLHTVQRTNSQDALKASAEQNFVVARLTALKQRLVGVIQQNDEAPEPEQVPRMSLGIHDALIASLREDGKQQVSTLRQSLQRICRAKAVEWERIKSQCWNNMLHPSQAISGIRKPVLVYSYAIPSNTKHTHRLQQIEFLLGVEAAEWGATGRRSKKSIRVIRAADADAEGRGDEDLAAVDEDSLTGLYTEWDLSTFQRRLIAKIVLEGKVQQKKEEFNNEFARVQKLQAQAVDILMDQNQRLKDAVDELDCMGYNNTDVPQPVQVHPHPDEDGAAVFSTSSGASNEANGEKGTKGLKSSGQRDGGDKSPFAEIYDRALRAMMNGELHSKGAKNMIWVLEKPNWMQQSPNEWTDEQKQLAVQLQAEQKRIDDFREGRRQAVDAEIRTVKSTVEETCSKADTELEKLSKLKHATEKAVRELELRAIAACHAADTLVELGPKGAKQAKSAVLLLQKKEQQLRIAMQTTKEKVNEVQYALDQQTAQDRQIERSFRKDFQDLAEDVLSQLHASSKKWTRSRPADSILASNNSTDPFAKAINKQDFCEVVAEAPSAEQPAGCDAPTWQQFFKWYQSKAKSENSMIALQAELNEMRNLSDHISQAYERTSKKTQACIDRSAELQLLSTKNMNNVALSLDMKNGGVEINGASVDSSLQKDAVLLNLDNVHALNRVAREKAGGCVHVLEEIRDFKSGIYQLLFECKKLDMEGEDAGNRVRDLQLLRVTSEVNQLFANPGKASRKSNLEVQQMEAQMQHNLLLHKKSLSDRQLHLQSLTAGIGKKTKLNKQLERQIMDLAELLDDQVPAIEAMTATPDTSRPRAKGLATAKKLLDITRAQQTEVANLKATLHKLHLRSYPAFVDPRVMDPDLKQEFREIPAVRGRAGDML